MPGGSGSIALPLTLALLAGGFLFWEPAYTLVRDWLTDPNASYGLLLGPLALFLGVRAGRAPGARSEPALATVVLTAAVFLRWGSDLAAELFTMRFSMLLAFVAVVLYVGGRPQLRRSWLAVSLLFLSIPLPAVVVQTLALPLQFQASRLGAWLLTLRSVPVLLAGNVIHLPGRSLFVTEACSGLRSLTALIALGVLIGGLWLRRPASRIVLIVLAIPVAMLLNGIRIFLTGFLVYFVSPELGEGFMHLTEGWVIFVAAFAILGLVSWGLVWIEGRLPSRDVT